VQRTSGFFAEAREKRPWPRMCPRKRHVSRGGVPCPSQDGSPEGPAGGLAQAGRRGSVSSYPSRGWGSRGGIVSGSAPSPEPRRSRRTLQPAWPRSHDERCSSGSGRGNRCRARACPALVQPLAREPSAGGCRRAGAGPGSVSRRIRPRVRRWRRHPCSVRGRVVRRSFGFASRPVPRRRLRGRRRRAGRAERASARWPGSLAGEAGIGRCRGRARGSSWLQKSTSGARSRPRGLGLAGWLPAHAGELSG